MRRAFSETLVEIAEINEKLMFLTGDLGFQVFTELETQHPDKYINVGIAEGQMACCAAGLALSGYRPVIYSIASFVTGRAFEQIRVSINYQKLPVLTVGAGGGYIYANSGVTHHCAEDIGLMSLLPGMQVLIPGSPEEVRQLLLQYFDTGAPGYMRVGRFGEPEYQALEPVVLGKARLVREGSRLAILTTGDAVIAGFEAGKMLREQGVAPIHYQYHTVVPFDEKTLAQLASEVDDILVVEEHFPSGGLFAAVSSFMASHNRRPRLHRLGPPQDLILGSPQLNQLREDCNYSCDSIVETCIKLWHT